jgi:hypothetical protein
VVMLSGKPKAAWMPTSKRAPRLIIEFDGVEHAVFF